MINEKLLEIIPQGESPGRRPIASRRHVTADTVPSAPRPPPLRTPPHAASSPVPSRVFLPVTFPSFLTYSPAGSPDQAFPGPDEGDAAPRPSLLVAHNSQ